MCGERWVLPSSMYATLLLATIVATDPVFSQQRLQVHDVVAMFASYILTFQLTQMIARPRDVQVNPPVNVPLTTHHTYPHKMWWWLKIVQRLQAIPLCGNKKHGDALINELLETNNKGCPEAYSGVWYMHKSGIPMHLLTIHQHQWDVDTLPRFSMVHGVRPANLAGYLNVLGMGLCTTEIQEKGSHWIRTPTWCFGVFKLIPRTEWFYRVNNDMLLRVSYDHDGCEVFRYEMRRICRGNGRHTIYYREFMETFRGEACLKL